MHPETWQKLESVFFAALELSPEDRMPYLDRVCAGDPSFRSEIDAVLAAHAEEEQRTTSGGIETPDLMAGRGSMVGTCVGPYQLAELIALGGMGLVYCGRDTRDPDSAQVAIKVLAASRFSDAFRRRFRREQRILGVLDHPNIAKLLDAGLTDAGIPYLVMEYIDGPPIDTHCTEHGLSMEERLRLFCDTARAAHYAHQSNIVHRDLKPSNILVQSGGGVKLLDFGIAKILAEAGEQSGASLTESGMMLMSPSYAAPEQVMGGGITPATDIYALGVVLYVLMTGRLPLDLRGRPPGRVVGAILEETPRAPSLVDFPSGWSERMTATAPGGPWSGDRFRRHLKEKLEAIVLTALAKEPERRQPSALRLAEEIETQL